MVKSPKSLDIGRTMKAAYRAAEDGGGEIVKARELIDVRFLNGDSPSLVARRVLALMLGTAAGEGWANETHRITKREIRQAHKSNERITDTLDAVAAIRFKVEGISSRGKHAIHRIGLFEELTEETDDNDQAWVEFRFSNQTRRLLGSSDVYGTLNRAALLSFRSKYTVTLYELGCLYSGRRDPSLRLDVVDLRAKLGIEKGVYRDWTDLRRKVLDRAKIEIDQLAHFTLDWREVRQGRRVTAIELRFWQKSPTEIEEAARELERPRVGRKARREKTEQLTTEES